MIKFENNNNFNIPINENYFIKVPEDSDDVYLKPGIDNYIHLKVVWMIAQKSSFPGWEPTVLPANKNLFIDYAPKSTQMLIDIQLQVIIFYFIF